MSKIAGQKVSPIGKEGKTSEEFRGLLKGNFYIFGSKKGENFRVKLKHFLWLGDLKASLSNSSEKLIYKTPSKVERMYING